MLSLKSTQGFSSDTDNIADITNLLSYKILIYVCDLCCRIKPKALQVQKQPLRQ